jgi:hypothetical protein
MKNRIKSLKGYDIKPLLELEMAKYRIQFKTIIPVPIKGLAPVLRSRLGYILKGRFCPFQDYPHTSCRNCKYESHCLYPVLFSPTGYCIDKNNIGEGMCPEKPAKPFALDVLEADPTRYLVDGAAGEVELTLFGERALEFQRPMLESLTHALSSIHVSRLDIKVNPEVSVQYPLIPLLWSAMVPTWKKGQWKICRVDESFIEKQSVGRKLDAWLDSVPPLPVINDSRGEMLKIALRTPLDLKRGRKGITLTVLLQSIVARLRDLKRVYHPDNCMGNIPGGFYPLSDQVRTIEDVKEVFKQYDSYDQGQVVNIRGVEGSLSFIGDMEPFLPLLILGSLIGVGSKTAYGLGRYDLYRGASI